MIRLVLILCCLLSTLCAFSQGEREKLQELEQKKEFERLRQVRMQMDSGILFMDRGEYERAEEKLKFALANMKSVPSDLVFYFGKNSYFLEKYKQSVDWLTKYIQLKGTVGPFSKDAAEWLKKAETELLEERKVASQKTAEVLAKDFNIDCGPSGKVTCPVCSGTTLIIRKDYFGETYRACPYSDPQGLLTCEEYNLLIRGQLKPHTVSK